MTYEDDFVNEEIVDIPIDGRVFKYKPTTAGDENNWLNECLIIDEKSKPPKVKTDYSKLNKCKLENIVGVPYDTLTIGKITGIVGKDWGALNKEQRFSLFGKLKPSLFDKLINAMKAVDEPDGTVKKN